MSMRKEPLTGWREIELGELVDSGFAEIRTGPFGTQLRASDYTPQGVPVINVRNLGYGKIRPAELERVGLDVQEHLSTHLLFEGDVVFGRKGAVDRHVLITPREVGWMQGSDCIRFRLLPGSPISSLFLSQALLAPSHKAWMEAQCSHGSTMASLNQEIVSRIQIRVPDASIQRRIVAVLSAFDKLIDINERRIELLEDLARALYREWFVHFRFPGHEDVEFVDSELGAIPEGWEVRCLADLASTVVDGVDTAEVNSATPYVGLEHLPRRHTTLREWGSIHSVTSRKLRFARGDTLFGKIRPYFHKVVWMPFDGVASSDSIVIRPLEHLRATALVNAVGSSDALVGEAVATSNGTKMPRADPKALLGYPMALPGLSDELIAHFEQAAGGYLQTAAEFSNHNRVFATTRDLLLPRLVTGRLDISDVDLGDLLPDESE